MAPLLLSLEQNLGRKSLALAHTHTMSRVLAQDYLGPSRVLWAKDFAQILAQAMRPTSPGIKG